MKRISLKDLRVPSRSWFVALFEVGVACRVSALSSPLLWLLLFFFLKAQLEAWGSRLEGQAELSATQSRLLSSYSLLSLSLSSSLLPQLPLYWAYIWAPIWFCACPLIKVARTKRKERGAIFSLNWPKEIDLVWLDSLWYIFSLSLSLFKILFFFFITRSFHIASRPWFLIK